MALKPTTWLEEELSGITFAGAVKSLCLISNIVVQVSPLPQVKRWERRRNTGEADAAPYVSIAFGGWQWSLYGLFAWWVTQRPGFLILVHSNCLGALLGTYYTAVFLCLCKHPQAMNCANRYLSAVAALVVFQVCCVSVLPVERALFLVGVISSFCSFVGALSILSTVLQVLRTQNSRSIPGPYVCANCCSAMVWVLCGYVLWDPLVMYPNIAGVVASSTCILLKLKYPSDEANTDDGDEDSILSLLGLRQGAKPTRAAESTPLARSCRAGGVRPTALKSAVAAAAAAAAASHADAQVLRWGAGREAALPRPEFRATSGRGASPIHQVAEAAGDRETPEGEGEAAPACGASAGGCDDDGGTGSTF